VPRIPHKPRRPAPQEQPFGLLLSPSRAALYLGVSVSAFYVLRHTEGFPAPIDLPGRVAGSARPYFRRDDLRAWVRGLRVAA
jgi:predicted DNA-binding transcriptional regulator AlpA